MDQSTKNDNQLDLVARLEALLFVAPGAVSPSQLAAALELPLSEVESGLLLLDLSYQQNSSSRGLRLQKHHNKVQLTTSNLASIWIERFLGLEAASRLSRAALETLAIIAYQEPVTRPHIDSIRGVNSDGVLKSLLSKGLIQEVGRADAPGRPILYTTTADFLQHFGIDSISDLPELELSLQGQEQKA